MLFALIRYVIYLPFTLLSLILSILLSPFLSLLSIILKSDTLPGVLQWFSTVDDNLDGGLRNGYSPPTNNFQLWWNRTCWICRNPAYGFQTYLFGFKTGNHSVVWETSIGDGRWETAGDYCVNLMRSDKGKSYFTYRRIIKGAFGKNIRIWFGWNKNPRVGYHQIEIQIGFQPQ